MGEHIFHSLLYSAPQCRALKCLLKQMMIYAHTSCELLSVYNSLFSSIDESHIVSSLFLLWHILICPTLSNEEMKETSKLKS